jgi:hypothetical protein
MPEYAASNVCSRPVDHRDAKRHRQINLWSSIAGITVRASAATTRKTTGDTGET